MPAKTKYKLYIGTKNIDNKNISCFTVSTSKKSAARIFGSSSSFKENFMGILDVKEAKENEIYELAIKFPERLFVKNNSEENLYRLFYDEERFLSGLNLIYDLEKKNSFLENALKKKNKYIKIRVKDEIALKENMNRDLYLDISDINNIKRFYFIPFSEKLIDDRWQHRAIETNYEISHMISEMFDIYDETIVPYSANRALDFIQL